MRKMKILSMMFFLGTFVALSYSSASADTQNRDTFLTFSAPVQVPGKDLMPGRYEFKLIDPLNTTHVIGVFDSKGNLVDQFLTLPEYLNHAANKPMVSFEARKPHTPEAIKSLAYPGSTMALEFVYPPEKVKE